MLTGKSGGIQGSVVYLLKIERSQILCVESVQLEPYSAGTQSKTLK